MKVVIFLLRGVSRLMYVHLIVGENVGINTTNNVAAVDSSSGMVWVWKRRSRSSRGGRMRWWSRESMSE